MAAPRGDGGSGRQGLACAAERSPQSTDPARQSPADIPDEVRAQRQSYLPTRFVEMWQRYDEELEARIQIDRRVNGVAPPADPRVAEEPEVAMVRLFVACLSPEHQPLPALHGSPQRQLEQVLTTLQRTKGAAATWAWEQTRALVAEGLPRDGTERALLAVARASGVFESFIARMGPL